MYKSIYFNYHLNSNDLYIEYFDAVVLVLIDIVIYLFTLMFVKPAVKVLTGSFPEKLAQAQNYRIIDKVELFSSWVDFN